MLLLHPCFQRNDSACICPAYEIVPAAMAVFLAGDWFRLTASGLAQAGERIVFTQKADNKMSLAAAGFYGGLNAARPQFHLKSMPFKQSCRPGACLKFPVRPLRIFPYIQA